MKSEDTQKKILEIFAELEKKAKEIYPDIENNIETFNSMRVEQESYLNYLTLLNEQSLSKASNQTSIE
ncbi:MAG: hypothetical protein A2315_00675 [Ignavibacteria bacterium RIFOXYB2_FULL_35_12]|nr:MAG: hypothetical protein A2058_11385 [Ignavibacteria bacterium GWA2_36_19]OGU53556.1 MAG: hypothetical protein A2006_01265 [Ignavibacteria bacterium GWC2_35_8]OGU60149.1 MAG: hypothetical protein A2X60_16350 [Ignavibacteria bacterium GWF2_35_20]OGU78408.1 MAG: hypothetical protein A2254_12760 [Ignavibacteria bacterium RIFOXYA2_FULL_35_9]OGU88492.1 MAG: hypothetical protein A2492_05435 [Ignavibacteria bacterium RIFOXYC12_FULL_35_11]OGU91307.1 MAG: hypothetical protein A3K31_06930 [Ignavibac